MSSLVRVVLLVIALLAVTVALSDKQRAHDIPECNKSELLAVLKPLKSNSNYPRCRFELGPSIQPCSVAACKSLIAPMLELNLPNCSVRQPGFDYIPASLKRHGSAVCEKTEDRFLKMSHLFYGRVVKDLLVSM